jgi:hypothetical protein
LSRTALYLAFLLFTACSTAEEGGQQTMNTENSCSVTALSKSQHFIRAILDDISANYSHVGGGGISQIKLTATNTFEISILQEERIDQITYELEINDACKVTIKNKTIDAIMPWEEPSK